MFHTPVLARRTRALRRLRRRIGLEIQRARMANYHRARFGERARAKLAQGGHLRKYYPLSAEGRAEYEAWQKRQKKASPKRKKTNKK